VLTATEYSDGDLDWYSFDASQAPDLGNPADAVTPEIVRPLPILPTLVRYPGMPADRYWEFEDGSVNLGMVEAGPTDLTRMLLTEFGLIYGNDWFIAPLDLPVGSLLKITRLSVRDTFGVESEVKPSRNADGTPWTMFGLTTAPNAPAYLRDVFFLAPTLPAKLQGDPVEEVALFRDELANMVWGVERRVQGASGEAYNRYHEATQIIARQQLAPSEGEAALTADILYRLATSVPENWIPFVGVPARADQPGSGASLNMADDQKSPSRRVAHRDKTTLVLGMIRISEGCSQRIIEHSHGVVERDAVLLGVRYSLGAVPLEAHRTIPRVWSALCV